MTPKVDGTKLDQQVLELIQDKQVVTAKYAAAVLGSNRQKVIWHLRRLMEGNLLHQAMTIRKDNLHHVWVIGATTTLTAKEVEEIALAQFEEMRTRAQELTSPDRQFKTTWADGINPWTKEEQNNLAKH